MGEFIVIFLNEQGKEVEKRFTNYRQYKAFLEKVRHSKRVRLLSSEEWFA